MALMIGMAAVGLAMNLAGSRKSKAAQRTLLAQQREMQAQQKAQNRVALLMQRRQEERQARVAVSQAEAAMKQSGVGASSSMESVMAGVNTGMAERLGNTMFQLNRMEQTNKLQEAMAKTQGQYGKAQQMSNFGGSLISTALSSQEFANMFSNIGSGTK